MFTAEEAAQERGVATSQIVKTMVVRKGDGRYCLALVAGDRRMSLKKARKQLADPEARLATREEASEATGYPVGAVAPLGLRHKNVDILFDRRILAEEQVALSSGDPNSGVVLRPADLLSVLPATLCDVSE